MHDNLGSVHRLDSPGGRTDIRRPSMPSSLASNVTLHIEASQLHITRLFETFQCLHDDL